MRTTPQECVENGPLNGGRGDAGEVGVVVEWLVGTDDMLGGAPVEGVLIVRARLFVVEVAVVRH